MDLLQQDQAARASALDPSQSFIVQAPAGSGKTELLTQRFLVLLGQCVQHPEEIIAITFTRKAAAEMRSRVIEALTYAEHNPPPSEPHKKQTYTLAKQVLTRDKTCQWQLSQNPNRLRIMTIDSLCARLCMQMPTLAQFPVEFTLIEQAQTFYQDIVEKFIAEIINHPVYGQHLKTVLLHLDNRLEQMVSLLANLLAKRDQWLPLVLQADQQDNLRAVLEDNLQMLLRDMHQAAQEATKRCGLWSDLIACAKFAGEQCAGLCSLDEAPSISADNQPIWQALAHLLLTKDGKPRQKLTKAQGFPAKSDAKDKAQQQQFAQQKACMQDIISRLSQDSDCLHAWQELHQSPPSHFSSTQWQMLASLLPLLKYLAAFLQLEFETQDCLDFVALNLSALAALGDEQQPTDLALYLDYQIKHLLIDEFQDTSLMQWHLLEKLTREWQPDDGRSLFIVGDPMQSIYRFRNAEVGIFLRAQTHGINQLALTSLHLTRNFRSDNVIVDWVNETFADLFPAYRDIASGAVPLSPALAAHANQQGRVQCHALISEEDADEANHLCQLIKQQRQTHPSDSMALLVRSRQQLPILADTLRQWEIDFQAIELEELQRAPEIQDLVTLLRALLHLADQTHWLALLRSPYVGLSLADLLVLVNQADTRPLWEACQQWASLDLLSNNGKKRLQRFVQAMQQAFATQGRISAQQWLQTTWLNLGGAACLQSKAEWQNVNTLFALVDTVVQQLGYLDCDQLIERLSQQHVASLCHGDNPLQIMTIHKAKGLEFDHVFLPGCHRRTPSDRSSLLLWTERPAPHSGSYLLLAPIKDQASEEDRLYQYCQQSEKTKLQIEQTRLLYVAATRARKSLHWLARISPEQYQKPNFKGNKNTPLWQLWAQFQQHPPIILPQQDEASKATTDCPPYLQRLPLDWQAPTLKLDKRHNQPSANRQFDIRPDVSVAKHIGSVVHEGLALLAATTPSERKALIEQHDWAKRLVQLGIMDDELAQATHKVKQALQQVLGDKTGQWILSTDHPTAYSEYPVTLWVNGQAQHGIIDRVFLDQQGIGWIIDYKTSIPQPTESLGQFKQQQYQQYEQQLSFYQQAMQALWQVPMKTLLYFPMIQTNDSPEQRQIEAQ